MKAAGDMLERRQRRGSCVHLVLQNLAVGVKSTMCPQEEQGEGSCKEIKILKCLGLEK